ncbi:MAG: hypothetical protein ABWZ25_18125 [Chitinophagaceae bacterium]
MTEFNQEIASEVGKLKSERVLDEKRAIFQKIYGRFGTRLYDHEFNDVVVLDDFTIGFLSMLATKYDTLFKSFREELENSFFGMYRESDDIRERHMRPESELSLQSIQLPSSGNSNWQLMYEMKSDDTIFHVELSSWEFNLVGITH